MKRIFACATLGALLLSGMAGAETYKFKQRISGLHEPTPESAGPSPVEDVVYDEDGWALVQRVSTGLEPDVTDEQWVQLRDAMSMGIRVEFADGVEWFSSAEALRNANCRSISDVDSLRTPGPGNFYFIAWSETVGCTLSGSDYSVLYVKRDGNGFVAAYDYASSLFENTDKIYRGDVEAIWIK